MKTVHDVMQHKLRSGGNGEVFSIAPIASVFDAIEMMSDCLGWCSSGTLGGL